MTELDVDKQYLLYCQALELYTTLSLMKSSVRNDERIACIRQKAWKRFCRRYDKFVSG